MSPFTPVRRPSPYRLWFRHLPQRLKALEMGQSLLVAPKHERSLKGAISTTTARHPDHHFTIQYRIRQNGTLWAVEATRVPGRHGRWSFPAIVRAMPSGFSYSIPASMENNAKYVRHLLRATHRFNLSRDGERFILTHVGPRE